MPRGRSARALKALRKKYKIGEFAVRRRAKSTRKRRVVVARRKASKARVSRVSRYTTPGGSGGLYEIPLSGSGSSFPSVTSSPPRTPDIPTTPTLPPVPPKQMRDPLTDL